MSVSSIQVTAYAIASTLSVKDVEKILAPHTASRKLTKTQLTITSSKDRFIVVYDFGAVVLFGFEEAERKQILDEILAKAGPEPHPPMQEELVVEIDPECKPQAVTDRVAVQRLDLETVELVALVIAQSAAIEYYEEDVDTLFAQVQGHMRVLEERGTFRGSVTGLVKFIGSAMTTRNQVVSTLSLLETPQMVWENVAIESVYLGLRSMFEIEDRLGAIEHKLEITQDNLEILVDVGQQRRSFALEVAIAIMIALEIVLVVYQIIKDR